MQLEESKSKRGRVNINTNHMIVTETVYSINKSLLDKGFNVSLESVLDLKPFFETVRRKCPYTCLNYV